MSDGEEPLGVADFGTTDWLKKPSDNNLVGNPKGLPAGGKETRMAKWILEGTWSGYNSAQRRVSHRVSTTRKSLAESWKKLYAIEFTDHTRLEITVREAKRGEHITEIKGYTELINDALDSGKSYYRVIDGLKEVTEARDAQG